MHNQRQQRCSRTALWNLLSVAILECPALCRGTEAEHVRLGRQENEQHDHRDVHNQPGPVFLYRPGLAVYPSGWSHWVWREPDSHHQRLRGAASSSADHRHNGVFLHHVDRQGRRHESRHFHQLFHQLRLAHSSAYGDVLGRDLGHFDDLLGIRHERVEETEDVWQLFHRLRHKSIEDLHHGGKTHKVDDVLHGVPLDPPVWPRRLCQAGRPPPAMLFVVQAEEHRLGRRSPRPWPSSVLVRSGATTWPGPQRSTAAHVATMSAVVAACDAEQLRSWAARLGPFHRCKHTPCGYGCCCCCCHYCCCFSHI